MTPRLLAAFFATAFALSACVVHAAPDCANAALQRDAQLLAAIRARLAAVSVPEDTETQVPDEARADLDALKDEIANLVARAVDCQSVDPAPALGEVQESLAHLAPNDDDDAAPRASYGGALQFEVSLGADARRLLFVVSRFAIPCGHDAVLSVFEPRGGRYRERMRWHSKPYATIAGAFESFQFRVSPADADGGWFVVTSHIKPWCSSTWSMIGYEALRPDARPEAPRVLYQGESSIWWGNDDFGALTAEVDAFDVRFHAGSADSGVHDRVHVRRYAVRGVSVERVQPVAESPRDFVDEWAQLEWSQARAWTAEDAAPRLARVHESLARPGKDLYVGFEFGPARRCAPDEIQIEVTMHDERRIFFMVRGNETFVLADASASPDPRCVTEGPE